MRTSLRTAVPFALVIVLAFGYRAIVMIESDAT